MEQYNTGVRSTAFASSEYIRKVYGWMTIGLILTGVTAWYISGNRNISNMIFSSKYIWFGLIIAQLGVVIALSAAVQRMSAGMATLLFILYSVLTGITLSVIFLVYPIGTISNAFFTAAGMFLIMSLYGTFTKRDLTSWGTFLMMGLIGVVIATIVNIFLKSSMMDFVISCIGVLVFTGLTAYDTQKLRALGSEMDMNDASGVRRMVILGALTLYLDFINLFLMLLRLFGGRNR